MLHFLKLQSQSASEAIHIVENELGYGARSLAMAGAFAPLGDGPAGMYWNPAGLADIKNGSFYFESYFVIAIYFMLMVFNLDIYYIIHITVSQELKK